MPLLINFGVLLVDTLLQLSSSSALNNMGLEGVATNAGVAARPTIHTGQPNRVAHNDGPSSSPWARSHMFGPKSVAPDGSAHVEEGGERGRTHRRSNAAAPAPAGTAARGPLPGTWMTGRGVSPHVRVTSRQQKKRPEHKRRENGKRISKYGPGYNYPGPAPASVLLLL